jgi:hypothetical protein
MFYLFSNLKKNLLSVSCMIYVQWRVAFEGQHCTISDCSLASPRTLARGVREGGISLQVLRRFESM